MQKERVADDIYVFTSELYAQVTAGAIITSEGSILIDTLVFPQEAKEIKAFLEDRLGAPVRYVVNTHYHADHTYGTCFFEGAIVVAHALCRELLDTKGREALEAAKQSAPVLEPVRIILPEIVFHDGYMNLHLGGKTLRMWHTPGHSPDSIVCLAVDDGVLFAADTLMPLPYFVDGDYDDFLESLESLRGGGYESVVQGHGEVVLRGEFENKLESDIRYLRTLREKVEVAFRRHDPQRYLESLDVESCGKSRIPLAGAVQELHQANVMKLYHDLKGKIGVMEVERGPVI